MVGVRQLRQIVLLLRRMSTAVFLLVALSLASAAGTLVEQGHPMADYVTAYGSFWAAVLDVLALFDVYRAPWFLLGVVVLLVSVTVCMASNGRGIWRQVVSRRQAGRPPAGGESVTLDATVDAVAARLHGQGFREHPAAAGVRFFERGRWLRLGYFAVHGGVVLLALAGVLSGFFGYRATMNIREDETARAAYLFRGDDITPVSLPFSLTHTGFDIDHYATGMPRHFAANVTIARTESPVQKAVIEVNKPLRVGRHVLYLASFGDGGSEIALKLHPLGYTQAMPQALTAAVYETVQVRAPQMQDMTLELTDFRAHTVVPDATALHGMRNVGPSLDVVMRRPDAAPVQVRIYAARPDLLGVGDGADGFETVSLGLSPDQPVRWQALQALLAARSAQPDMPLKQVLESAVTPVLAQIEPAERMSAGLAVLQAAQVVAATNLPVMMTVNDFDMVRYASLQVAYDPGAWLFWLAGVLLVVGSGMMVYGSHVRVWVEAADRPGQVRVVVRHRGQGSVDSLLASLREPSDKVG